jgi:hypothetical protein
MRYGSIYNILYTIMGVNYIGFLNHNNVSCTMPIHQASVKFHERATSSTSPSAPSALPSPPPRTTASTRRALRSALLRNYTTVLNRDNCVRKHMTAQTASRDVTLALSVEAPAALVVARTEMNEARRVGSSEEPKSAWRDVGWIDWQSDGGWRGGSGWRKRKTREG